MAVEQQGHASSMQAQHRTTPLVHAPERHARLAQLRRHLLPPLRRLGLPLLLGLLRRALLGGGRRRHAIGGAVLLARGVKQVGEGVQVGGAQGAAARGRKRRRERSRLAWAGGRGRVDAARQAHAANRASTLKHLEHTSTRTAVRGGAAPAGLRRSAATAPCRWCPRWPGSAGAAPRCRCARGPRPAPPAVVGRVVKQAWVAGVVT